MATPTYTLIEEQALGSSAASVTFSSIPGTYKDLVLEIIYGNTTDNWRNLIRLNGDSGSNYSQTYLSGDGTNVVTSRQTSQTSIATPRVGGAPTTLTGIDVLQFFSYTNTSVYKTVLERGSAASRGTEAAVGLWRSSSAITSISITAEGANYMSASTFRLWGIA